MDLFLAICEAIGLGLAAGIGGPLAWLFIAVMARFEAGIDTRGTDWEFVGSDWFLATMFAVNVGDYLVRRREPSPREVRYGRIQFALAAGVLGGVFGAAALAAEGESDLLGFVLGALAAFGAGYLANDVLEGARARASAGGDPGASAGLNLIFGLVGIATAALALYLPPASLLALVALLVLARGRRRKAGEKYEGLRILR